MKLISANEAAMLMPRNAKANAVLRINKMIETAAKNDRTQVRVDFLADITGDRVSLTKLGETVIAEFEAQGFMRREIYDCGQFVDVGIAICWPEKAKGTTT